MKKITAVAMFILVIFAIFFETANAGISSKEYDAVSDEMLIEYGVLDKDTVWDICNKITVKQMSMDFIEKNIMAPSNITDPTKIRIGKVLKIRIKKSDFKDIAPDVILTGDSPAIERQQSAVSSKEKFPALAKDTPALSTSQGNISDKNMAAILTENRLLVEKFELLVEKFDKISEDLKVADVRIKNLEKMILEKDNLILAMKRTEAVKSKGKEIITSNQELGVVAEIQKAAPEWAVVQYNQKRTVGISVAILITFVLFIYLMHLTINNIRAGYNPRKERTATG